MRLTRSQRALAAAGAAYSISPLDPIPGFIPVLGQLDDLAVVLLGLDLFIRSAPQDLVDEHLAKIAQDRIAINLYIVR